MECNHCYNLLRNYKQWMQSAETHFIRERHSWLKQKLRWAGTRM
jgi:hypothetical protein